MSAYELWQQFAAWAFGPHPLTIAELEQIAQPAGAPSEPLQPELSLALLALAEQTDRASEGLIDITRDEIAEVIAEALWQIAHAVRDGHDVEIPEIGVLRWVPLLGAGGARIEFTPDDGLYEEND